MEKLINNKFIIALLILPFLEPRGISEMAMYIGGVWYFIDFLFKILKIISFLVIIVLSFYELQKFSLIFLLIGSYEGVIIVSSFLNENINMNSMMTAISILGACVLTDFYIRKGNAVKYLEDITIILGVFIIINVFSILLYPNGMYINDRGWNANYFLGYKNLHIYTYLLFYVALIILQHIKNEKFDIKYFSIFLVIFFSAVISQSSTSIVSMGIIFLATYFFRNVHFPRFVNVFNVYIVSMICSVMIIFFRFQEKFSFLIENILKKDLTFTSRTAIWRTCIEYIENKPIFGNGTISFDFIFKNWIVSQAHNQFLDIVLMGGLILLFVFSLVFILESKKISNIKTVSLRNLLLFVFVAYFVLFQTEARRDDILMFIGFVIVYHINNIINKFETIDGENRKYRKYIRIVLH